MVSEPNWHPVQTQTQNHVLPHDLHLLLSMTSLAASRWQYLLNYSCLTFYAWSKSAVIRSPMKGPIPGQDASVEQHTHGLTSHITGRTPPCTKWSHDYDKQAEFHTNRAGGSDWAQSPPLPLILCSTVSASAARAQTGFCAISGV